MHNSPKDIAIADYDYPLPDERIAKFPLDRRDQSKLLIYRNGTIAESRFNHIGFQQYESHSCPSFLPKTDGFYHRGILP